MRKLTDRLHVRLAFVVGIVGILVSIAGSLIVFQLAQAEQQRFSAHLLNQIAQGSVKPAAISVYVNDIELAQEILASLQINDLILAAEIRNENGVVAETSLKDISGEPIACALPHPFLDSDVVGELLVDQRLHGPPMSFMHNGKQYIAVAGGGRDNDDELLLFALPQD